MPLVLKNLYTRVDDASKNFRTFVRTYNNTFAFTSLGIHQYDKDLCKRNKGIYTFKVQGQMYHFINNLLPYGCPPRNLQLYFYDTDHKIKNRVESVARLEENIVRALMEVMSCNPYANFFRSLKDVVHSDDFSILLNSSPSLDQRLYNSPTASQVAAVWIEDYDGVEDNRNIRVYAHCGRSQNIQYYYGCYDPLQYPLLFPFGDVGWHEGIQRALQSRNLQPLGYANSLSINANTQSSVDDLIREGQVGSDPQYLAENIMRINFSVGTGAVFGNEVGRRVILPSSFIGGPRDMRGRYMDAMSLVQNFGKPDMFLTMTCNPNWPEIKGLLQYNDDAQNRPDLIARVFHAKRQELKNDITNKQFFGEVVAYTYVIEFQKRGLPHAHFLIILKDKCHAMSPSFVDNFVSAEIPDKHLQPALYELVKKHMVHGPCGFLNPNCPCMIQRKCKSVPTCKSKYPKLFSHATEFTDDSYPIYKRRNTPFFVQIKGFNLDNRWIVPYNPHLLLKFDCHINVEVCASIKSVKYIYKYIYKGHDRVSITLGDNTDERVIDEIKEYQNARWISPPEAAWRIFGIGIAEMKPAVIQLQIHLENSQYINFYGHERITYIVSREDSSRTMLTELFAMNLSSDFARTLNLLYVEFPCHFVWCKSSKSWKPRKKHTVIGRLVAVNPTEGERYYLRFLLMNVRAPTSFDCLRTVNGKITSSFHEAIEKLGLLAGDFVVEESLNEAVLFQMPSSLQTFFATLLIFCDISNPISLWMKYKTHVSRLLKTGLHTNAEAESLVLKMIANIVQEMGKKTKDYCLFDLLESYDFPGRLTNEILHEKNLTVSEADLLAIHQLNVCQRSAFKTITDAVLGNKPSAFFVDGPGGTGKTFLYRCLLVFVRSKGLIALTTATSGIAASILPGGRTAHSRFKLALDGNDKYICNIGKHTADASLLRHSKLILWDEASMAHRNIVESLDTTLKDIMDCHDLFGEKVIVFGGDFKQTLPVVRHGKKEDFIAASLVKSSTIWPHICHLNLVENMRAHADPTFASYLMKIGNGTEPAIYQNKIKEPSQFLDSKLMQWYTTHM
ncbi:uncharacterized protein LOC116029646 [Ipomoea triloba]|uniref:uncharacterized protein LOC116029646 n=1 Tax=Ipomoea triloba TaxID=35885 RepID=UPI00125D11AD|nr:uncharacterized protein LOC116029646 [Ipomoea triloba]